MVNVLVSSKGDLALYTIPHAYPQGLEPEQFKSVFRYLEPSLQSVNLSMKITFKIIILEHNTDIN